MKFGKKGIEGYPEDAACSPSEQHAIKAVAQGRAEPHQQRLALDWIVTMAAGYYQCSYRKGDKGETDFNEGRRYVAQQIVKASEIRTVQRGEPQEQGEMKEESNG